MEVNMTKRLMACFGVMLLFVACQRGTEPAVDTSSTSITETMTQTTETETAITDTSTAPAPSTVQVSLVDYRIEMPASLPAGMTTFEIRNNGQRDHNFEIEGQGVEQKLPANLKRGQSGTLEVDLRPGTYTVYCPVGNHAEEHGMTMQLTVTG
jgi:uncharacterized cupredoxin-like copper-binding protein